jgi:hypothetical protein
MRGQGLAQSSPGTDKSVKEEYSPDLTSVRELSKSKATWTVILHLSSPTKSAFCLDSVMSRDMSSQNNQHTVMGLT